MDSELVSRVRSSLLSSFDGQLSHLDGVVVVRAEPPNMSAPQSEASTAFDTGLLAGIAAGRATAVGAQVSSTVPSQISWYKGKGLSSVDDLDTVAGQTALVYALAGQRGTYGSSSTADSLLPTVAVPSQDALSGLAESPRPSRRREQPRPRTALAFRPVHALPFLVALATACRAVGAAAGADAPRRER